MTPSGPASSERTDAKRGSSPPTTGARAPGSCEGKLVGTRTYSGAKLAIYYDADLGRNCARLDKTQFVGQKSYLKLSLCNSTTGRCDRDWNYYTHYAGPVSVPAKGQCISWTVAVLNPKRTSWTQEETGDSGYCRWVLAAAQPAIRELRARRLSARQRTARGHFGPVSLASIDKRTAHRAPAPRDR